MNPTTDRSRRPGAWLFPVFALAVGVLGAVAVWLGLAITLRSTCAWMAPLAALDMVLMLRLAAAPPGRLRATAAVLATVSAIVAAYWMIVATQMGLLLGLSPAESAQRLGPVLAGELLRHGTDAWDLGLALLALGIAWWLGR
jgi:hypothetical protein